MAAKQLRLMKKHEVLLKTASINSLTLLKLH